MSATNWKPKLKDWRKVDKETLKFIYEQGDKYLKYSLEVGKKASDRAFSLILFMFPLLSACILAMMIPTVRQHFKQNTIYGIMILGAGLAYCCYEAILVVMPRHSVPPGRLPSEITTSQLLENPSWGDEDRIRFLYFNEISNLQNAIKFNNQNNDIRIKGITRALYALSLLLFSVLFYVSLYGLSNPDAK